MRSLGVGSGVVEKRVGNLLANASGLRSRFVLVLVADCVGLVARSVAVFGPLVEEDKDDGLGGGGGSSTAASSTSLPESIMLSPSFSSKSSFMCS